MRTTASLATALLLATGLLAGCGQHQEIAGPGNNGAGSQDQAEVAAVVAQTPEVVEDGEYENEDPATFEASAEASVGLTIEGTDAAIVPLRWWRHIRHVERRFEFAFGDTDSTGRPRSAVVTVHKRLEGTLNIVAADPPPQGEPVDTTTIQLIQKPLVDHWVRRLLLRRVMREGMERPLWRVVATSGVEVGSRSHVTTLVSLRIQSGDVDTTLTDPLAFQFLRRIVKLQPEAEVTLTATTQSNTDVVILYNRRGRHRFANNGDGTFTARFRTTAFEGLRHLGVNALTRGTLFDDQAPYDSHAWLLPYLVVPAELGEELPPL